MDRLLLLPCRQLNLASCASQSTLSRNTKRPGDPTMLQLHQTCSRRHLAKLTWDFHRCDGRVWRGLCSLPPPSYPLHATSALLPQQNPEAGAGEHKFSCSRNPVNTLHLDRVIICCLQSFSCWQIKENGGTLEKAHTPASPPPSPAQCQLPCFKILNPSAQITTKPTKHQLLAHWTPWVGMQPSTIAMKANYSKSQSKSNPKTTQLVPGKTTTRLALLFYHQWSCRSPSLQHQKHLLDDHHSWCADGLDKRQRGWGRNCARCLSNKTSHHI